MHKLLHLGRLAMCKEGASRIHDNQLFVGAQESYLSQKDGENGLPGGANKKDTTTGAVKKDTTTISVIITLLRTQNALEKK